MNRKEPFLTKKSLINWFGDRGEIIKLSWIKDWIVKGDYLYLQWTDKAPRYLKPDAPYDVNWVNWKSLCFEFQDEGYLVDIISDHKSFDGWEYPFSCKKCGRIDNNDKQYPITYLDTNTKLCELCFEDHEENGEER